MTINKKYFNDISSFPKQFNDGLKIIKSQIPALSQKAFTQVTVCGMGGSSLYVEVVNQLVANITGKTLAIKAHRTYGNTLQIDSKTLYIVASYSGNTEETIDSFNTLINSGLKNNVTVFTSGGKLLELAKHYNIPSYKIPTGIQPRLATGYFMIGLLHVLTLANFVDKSVTKQFLDAATNIEKLVDQKEAQILAKKLYKHVPVVYTVDTIAYLARIAKIKFNENSKIASFWYYFPELNHNEMIGFTNRVMPAYFLILSTQFTVKRNQKRIETFSKVINKLGYPVYIYNMKGKNLIEQALSTYMFIDYVTYYLAEAYNTDPEPVPLVEEFKRLLRG